MNDEGIFFQCNMLLRGQIKFSKGYFFTRAMKEHNFVFGTGIGQINLFCLLLSPEVGRQFETAFKTFVNATFLIMKRSVFLVGNTSSLLSEKKASKICLHQKHLQSKKQNVCGHKMKWLKKKHG